MTPKRNSAAGLLAAIALTLSGGPAYAQSVQTPYSPPETGPALLGQDAGVFAGGVPCETPYSPNECGPAEMPGRGGTQAPEMGGTIFVEGGMETLPVTPDSDEEVNRLDD